MKVALNWMIINVLKMVILITSCLLLALISFPYESRAYPYLDNVTKNCLQNKANYANNNTVITNLGFLGYLVYFILN